MQSSLFDQAVGEKIEIKNGELWWFPNWLTISEADFYFKQLKQEISWQQSEIQIAGKLIPVPRLNAWYGEKETRYAYSGISFDPLPFTETLDTLKHRVLETFKSVHSDFSLEINSALANLYRDGNDSVAWHADDERELGDAPQIASVSLGASRRFLLKPNTQNSKTVELMLTPGSLLFMLGDIQNHWVHSIPKADAIIGPRINLTFRQVVCA
ncbi:MAG: alpha-ketoglutarate-dependent dioxygenase AlkB [Cellvibrionaceae bacterium]